MRWVILSAVILAALATTTEAQAWMNNVLDMIDNHDNYEGAPYEVKAAMGKFEERFYPSQKWVCTQKQAKEGENVGDSMFMKLFRYISRQNVGRVAIKMTVPVSTQISKGQGVKTWKHRMCFYLGKEHQDNPPQPTDDQVFIEDREGMTILTRKLPGYMNEDTWKIEAGDLQAILNAAGESFDPDTRWNVGYDSPYKFWDRRNEVWFQKN